MRKILFKAKRLVDDGWAYGDLSQHKTGKKFIKAGSATHSFEVDADTICQYTGLTDKNGNKIWENDVIRYVDGDLAVDGIVRFGRHEQIVMLELGFYVDWVSEGTECFKTDICYWVEKRNIEVIGNIFDNPELLKGSEENG